MKIITINGEIGWDVTAGSFKNDMRNVGANEELKVFINSPGGSVFQGISIYNMIKDHKGETTTEVTGLAASMGSYILMAGDNKIARENSTVMIHNALISFISGDHNKLRKRADMLESLSKMIGKSYVKQTGKSEKEVSALMDAETWLFGSEIEEAGFVDSTIEVDEKEGATNRAEAVALCRMEFEECLKKVQNSDTEGELEQIAAFLGDKLESSTSIKNACGNKEPGRNLGSINNNSNESKDMDLSELKVKHPVLYQAVLDEGKKIEKDRVNAHITMSESTGAKDYALKCIKEDKNMSSQEVVAGYLAEGMRKREIEDREDDNPKGDLNLDNSDEGEQKSEDEKAEALLKEVMDKSKQPKTV